MLEKEMTFKIASNFKIKRKNYKQLFSAMKFSFGPNI